MFKRLTLTNGDPIYVNPLLIAAAKPCYKGDEFTHTEIALANGGAVNVSEIIEEIDEREVGNYSPPNSITHV